MKYKINYQTAGSKYIDLRLYWNKPQSTAGSFLREFPFTYYLQIIHKIYK